MNLEALTSSHLFSKTHQSTLDLNRNDHDEHYGLSANSLIGSQIFQKLSEKFHSATNNNFNNNTNVTNSNPMNMIRNQIVLNSSNFDTEEIRKQMEYDKFMNEIWIGIVLTLIVISMVFCICSCFLYHQFRQWKRNYRQNMHQNQNDIESAKLNPEEDDPVPEYTLVSGLPSYEAALELLHKSPNSCLIVYPSIFNVFNTNEKESQSVMLPIQHQLSTTTATTTTTSTNPATTMPSLQSQSSAIGNCTASASQLIQSDVASTAIAIKSLTNCSSSNSHSQHSIPSYDEATAYSSTKSSHIVIAENCENALLENCVNFS